MPLYDRLGVEYDRTRRADPYLVSRLLAHLRLSQGEACLDVACGTGNYTAALAAAGLRMSGVDIAARMLGAARAKGHGRVAWVRADAAELPLRDGVFEGAVCTLALHHFPSLLPVFLAVRRVLHGGRFVLFTSTPQQTRGMWLCYYFPAAIERAAAQMPPTDAVRSALSDAGFTRIDQEPYEVAPDLQDLFLYSGKHRPDLYLDPRVRAGISAFATAPAKELEPGLRRLQRDIETGVIQDVIGAAQHEHGDYTFIIAETD